MREKCKMLYTFDYIEYFIGKVIILLRKYSTVQIS